MNKLEETQSATMIAKALTINPIMTYNKIEIVMADKKYTLLVSNN